MVMFELLNMEF